VAGPLGCEPGQGAHPDRDGEPVTDVGDGRHAFRERSLGALQVTALEAGDAEQHVGSCFHGGEAEPRGQLRAAFEPLDGDPEIVVENVAAPASSGATARPASSPAPVLQLQRPFNVRPTPGRVADDLSGAAPGIQAGGLADRVLRDALRSWPGDRRN